MRTCVFSDDSWVGVDTGVVATQEGDPDGIEDAVSLDLHCLCAQANDSNRRASMAVLTTIFVDERK